MSRPAATPRRLTRGSLASAIRANATRGSNKSIRDDNKLFAPAAAAPATRSTPAKASGRAAYPLPLYPSPVAATAAPIPKLLDRKFLEEDELCQGSYELTTILRTIFEYSELRSSTPAYPSETKAGFRYFVPSGALADEWMYFLSITPNRFFQMAPLDVQLSFTLQYGGGRWISQSFKDVLQEPPRRQETAKEIKHWAKIGGHFYFVSISEFNALSLENKRQDQASSSHPSEVSSPDSLGSHQTWPQHSSTVSGSITSLPRCTCCQPAASPPPIGTLSPSIAVLTTNTAVDIAYHDKSLQVPAGAVPQTSSQKRKRTDHSVDVDENQDQEKDIDKEMAPPKHKLHKREHAGQISIPTHNPAVSKSAPGFAVPAQNQCLVAPSLTRAQASSILAMPPGARSAPTAVPAAFAAVVPATVNPIDAWMATAPNRATRRHIGQGNKEVAWSRGHIRAFVELQGNSTAELPDYANSEYGHEMKSVAPPKTVDPTLLTVVTTAQELMTFLPYATVNHEVCERLHNSWTPKQIADYMHHARNLQYPNSYHRTMYSHQYKPTNVPATRPVTNVPSQMSPVTSHGKYQKPLHDYYLWCMGEGVVNYPTGRAAQLLSRVIHHVRTVSGDRNVLLSQVQQYATKWGITVPAEYIIQPNTNVVAEDTPSQAFVDTIHREFVQKFGRSSTSV